jgi:hypothetical protein
LSGLQAQAADYTPPSEPPAESAWEFTLVPYLWGAGLEGDVGLFGLEPQEIDLSLSDILKNFDIGFMAAGEARNGRFILGTDILYIKLGTDINTPHGIAADSIDVTAKSLMATAIAGYSVIYEENVTVDVFAGARLWYSDTSFDFKNQIALLDKFDGASDGDTWVDPLIGIKGRAGLGSGFFLTGWGMIGGFGVSSDLMWDVLGGVGYEFNDTFSLVAGYRAVSVDYKNDGFVYDVVQQGPILGFAFHF